MAKSDNLVYVCMAVDFVHPGHINILKEARKRGKVMVGLLTDRAIATYKDLPVLDYEDRKIILKNLKLRKSAIYGKATLVLGKCLIQSVNIAS